MDAIGLPFSLILDVSEWLQTNVHIVGRQSTTYFDHNPQIDHIGA